MMQLVSNRRLSTRYCGDTWQRGPSGLLLPPDASCRGLYGDRPIAIDLFCGCGGFSLGFIEAGFRVVAAIDNDPEASITYMHNLATYPVQIHYVEAGDKDRLDEALRRRTKARGNRQADEMILAGHGWINNQSNIQGVPHFWFGDIRKVTGQQMLDALGLKVGEVDAIMGGPPCQGFSTIGKRDVMDPRNSLVFEFARLILEIRPKTFVMENVPGMASMVTPEGQPVIEAFCHVLDEGGFGSFQALHRALLSSAGLKPGAAMRHSRDGSQKEANRETANLNHGQQMAFSLI